MTAAIVNMNQAKTELSSLVDRACAGEEVVIARNGTPAVRLTPVVEKPKGLRPIGLDESKFVVPDNFNDPMPDDFMKFFEEAAARHLHIPSVDIGSGKVVP